MGYTHYYGMNKAIKRFKKDVLLDVQVILDKYSRLIRKEYNSNEPASASEDLIAFNGIGREGNEIFAVSTSGHLGCLTENKPYDRAVCELLLILKHHYKENFSLSSDGFYVGEQEFLEGKVNRSWEKALQNVSEHFGYNYTFYPVITGSRGSYNFRFTLDESEAREVEVSVLKDFLDFKLTSLERGYQAGMSIESEINRLNQFLYGSLEASSNEHQMNLFGKYAERLLDLEIKIF